MALNINKLSTVLPESYPLYFFDANVWIAILKNNQYGSTEKKWQGYIDFFESVVQLNMMPYNLKKKAANIPKIAITSILLSEIINTYLRNVAMPAFLNQPTGNFKKDYRENPFSDYDTQLQMLVNDLKSYSNVIEFIDDGFSSIDILTHLDKLDRKMDFNDMYYYLQMKKLNIPIITDDKDFSSYDSIILTLNYQLLKKI